MSDLRKAAEMALEWIEAQPQPRRFGGHACIEALRKALTERKWVGLTAEEIRDAISEWAKTGQTVREMIYDIEDKLKEKNT